MDAEQVEGGNEEDTENKIVWGRNKKIDKMNRERYGRADPLNRITGQSSLKIEDALAWMSIIDGLSPALKADIYSWWTDDMVDIGLVQNSCYVACLPCQWDRYVSTFEFFHDQAKDEGMGKISAESIDEEWIKEHFDIHVWG